MNHLKIQSLSYITLNLLINRYSMVFIAKGQNGQSLKLPICLNILTVLKYTELPVYVYYGLLLGYRASLASFLMNVQMPEIWTLPGNSVWTETYYAYHSAVWRQIYIKTSLPMGNSASFAHKKLLSI
jgi:hypothetical protein